MSKSRTVVLSLLACVLVGAGLCTAAEIEAVARPSKDVTLSFPRPGTIAEVLAERGTVVKVGDMVLRQDDTVEQAEATRLRAESEDTTRVEAAQASLDQKKVEFQRIQEAAERGAATKLEVEQARLDVTIAELSLKLAQFNREQAARQYEQAKLDIDRMRRISPINGRVEEIAIEKGETADALEKVIRIVQIDPLWIDVPAPVEFAGRLRTGDVAHVLFPDAPDQPLQGKVIDVAGVADAASGTLNVRVELPNPASRPAGQTVRVVFPQTLAQDR